MAAKIDLIELHHYRCVGTAMQRASTRKRERTLMGVSLGNGVIAIRIAPEDAVCNQRSRFPVALLGGRDSRLDFTIMRALALSWSFRIDLRQHGKEYEDGISPIILHGELLLRTKGAG
jgi:hypothetical protein